MFIFLGIEFGNRDCKLQQIVPDKDGKPVQKTSDIVFWVVANVGKGILRIPISKLDMEHNKTVVLSQLETCYNDRTRTLLKKTENGMVVIPFGGILTH